MNPMLTVPDEDLIARIREHSDSLIDREIDEFERRYIVALYKLYIEREKSAAGALLAARVQAELDGLAA